MAGDVSQVTDRKWNINTRGTMPTIHTKTKQNIYLVGPKESVIVREMV